MKINNLRNDNRLKRGTVIQITTTSPFGKKIEHLEKIVMVDDAGNVLLTNGKTYHALQILKTQIK